LFAFKQRYPLCKIGGIPLPTKFCCQGQEEVAMCPRQHLSLAASIQLFERILTDDIQHAEAGCVIAVTAFILVTPLHQALIHQRGQPVENVDAERLHTVGPAGVSAARRRSGLGPMGGRST
jgi:hypothetical protein